MLLIRKETFMIPDYQTIMLPLLSFLSDQNEHKFREIVSGLAVKFNLSQEDLSQLLSSGVQTVFENRVGWAKTYLKKAGLINYPNRGFCKITEVGLKTLTTKPDKINVDYLKTFPQFNEFYYSERNESLVTELSVSIDTPIERMEKASIELNSAIKEDLLVKIHEQSPSFFEKMVVELIVKMGYGGSLHDAGVAIGRSGDEGVDGMIKEDKLGLDMIYIQAKRWNPDHVVGRPDIQQFAGALMGKRVKKGIFITTSRFTKEAVDYSNTLETKIILIDGKTLTNYMIEYNVGCTDHQVFTIKKINEDFFS